MSKKLIEPGTVFGKLTVIAAYGSNKFRSSTSLCRCECGKETIATNQQLKQKTKKSCGCSRHPTLPIEQLIKNSAICHIKLGARKRGYQFELSDELLYSLLDDKCHWCGRSNVNKSLKRYREKSNKGYNGIDRLDNSIGYTETNSVPCCWDCNRAKHNDKKEEFLEMCRLVVARHRPK